MIQYAGFIFAGNELDKVWELLGRCKDFTEGTSRELFELALARGTMQLWVDPDIAAPNAVCVTELRGVPPKKTAFILALAGLIPFDDFASKLERIKLWADKNGCASVTAECADAQMRLFTRYGFNKARNVIELSLGVDK